ncbi:MAG: hypothetical protein JSV86_08950 [Gemmatimonadota bacterium]|nr:MAG: hypothetical protein JSV86_08950 [Gemmatimonadota bacterium]
MRRTALLITVASLTTLLSCGDDEAACETREEGLQDQRWVLECVTDQSAYEVNLVGSYFDPEWTSDLPSGAHVYCSDRGPTFAWLPGVRSTDTPNRWREKTVEHRMDDGERVESKWMMSADYRARPTYYLFGDKARTFVDGLREGRELLLATRIEYDQEPTHRLVTLEGLRGVVDRIPCFREQD